MNHDMIHKLASDAGFGGTQRNTLAVKIEKFAELIERRVRLEQQVPDAYEQTDRGVVDNYGEGK